MKHFLRPLSRLFLILVLAALPLGCGGGDEESGGNYRGEWRGTTSRGGSIVFSVSGTAITSLRIDDPQASMEITRPVAIEGNTFAVANSEGVSSPTSPAVSVQGVFDSETQASGIYSISRGGQRVAGTFNASRL